MIKFVRSQGSYVITGLLFLILLTGVVIADDDPDNDNFSTPETIDVGTYSGTVGGDDTFDWYRIYIPERTEFKIEAWIVYPTGGENVEIVSCGKDGMPDDQINFFLNIESQRDTCHFWELEEDYYQYLEVRGVGEYKIKIFMGDEGGVSDWCCTSSIVIGAAMILMISVAIILIRRRIY